MSMTPETETAPKTASVVRPLLRRLEGIVSAAKSKKTIKVVLKFQTMHAKYGKYLTRHTVLQVHDEKGEAKEGDTVEIAECRPISRTKHHRLVKVLKRGAAFVKAEEPSELEV